MRVAFHTLGCKLNSTETAAIQRQFVAAGHSVVEYGSEADLLLINTCTVTEQADIECRKIVRRGLRGAPQAQVIVTGCYAQLQPEELASIEGVRAVVGTAEKMNIVSHLPSILAHETVKIIVDELGDATTFVGARSGHGNSRTRAFMKIQDGCDYSCTFCTIPIARGPARAMSMDGIRSELRSIALEGYQECIVSGINLGEYQSAQGHRLADVLRMICDMDLPYRVRIGSIEPNTLTDEVLEVWSASRNIVPHLHMPLQSGSDHILRSMKRRYNTRMYRERVEAFAACWSDAGIGIDVITGYPGETDELFTETIDFLASIPWTYLHVFTYSERERTPAATLEHSIPMNLRRDRTRILRGVSQERTASFHASQLGSQRTFLPEGYDAETGYWTGWTENHVAALLKAPYSLEKILHNVKLISIHDDKVVVEQAGHELE